MTVQERASTANGTVAWANQDNLALSDNTYGNDNGGDGKAFRKGFGYAIPTGSTIDKVEMKVEGQTSGTRQCRVYHSVDGELTDILGGTTTTFTGSDTTEIFDVTAQRTWTPGLLNDNDKLRFGVQRTGGSGVVSVDYVALIVTWTEPAAAGPPSRRRRAAWNGP